MGQAVLRREHEGNAANLRLSSTTSSAALILNTCSPTMSLLALFTSSFQSTERIGQGAVVSGEPQWQRYAPLSCLSL